MKEFPQGIELVGIFFKKVELVAQKTKKKNSVFILYIEQLMGSLGRKLARPQHKTLLLNFRKPFPPLMASSHMRCIHFPAGLERKPEREKGSRRGSLHFFFISLSFYLRRSHQVLELCKLLLLCDGLVCQSTPARLLFFPQVIFFGVDPYLLVFHED